jgi:dihydrofolate reductase
VGSLNVIGKEASMGTITAVEHVSLDGVMQAPMAPDEDSREGFEHGGWAGPDNDDVMLKTMQKGMAKNGGLLLGRRTYRHFAAVWPHMPKENPYTDKINNTPKFVVSSTLNEPLDWNNSSLLDGDVADAVPRLKKEVEHLTVLGSGELVRSLMEHDLVDEFVLQIHPIVLGSGLRLFTDGTAFARLRLEETVTTTTGVVIATYALRERT